MLKLNRLLLLVTNVLVMLLLFSGCQRVVQRTTVNQETAENVTDTTVQTVLQQNTEVQLAVEKSVVLERVKDIFRIIEDDQMSLNCFVESGMCDRMFCSKSLKSLLAAARRKEFETNLPCFEIDYWHMTRCSDLVYFDDFHVSRILIDGTKRATVSFYVSDAYEEVPASVDLVFENGHWVIDNFHQLKGMVNLRSSLWYYLNKVDYI